MSLTGLTGVFSSGTLSLLGSLSTSVGVLWVLGTVIRAAHSATNSSCWRWQRATNAASPCTRNVARSTFFPNPTNILDYPDTMSGYEKRKAAGQMRNSLLRKQRNRGALQEQVSPEFSSMICV